MCWCVGVLRAWLPSVLNHVESVSAHIKAVALLQLTWFLFLQNILWNTSTVANYCVITIYQSWFGLWKCSMLHFACCCPQHLYKLGKPLLQIPLYRSPSNTVMKKWKNKLICEDGAQKGWKKERKSNKSGKFYSLFSICPTSHTSSGKSFKRKKKI